MLLGEYEVELLDPQAARGAAPELRETAFGKMVPKGRVGGENQEGSRWEVMGKGWEVNAPRQRGWGRGRRDRLLGN